MIEKTSGINFKKFGDVYYESKNLEVENLICKQFNHTSKTISFLYRCNKDVYIELFSGLASIVAGKKPDGDTLELYAISHHVRIKAGTYFNIIPVSQEITCYMLINDDYILDKIDIPAYTYKPITPRIHINEILGYYYVIKGPQYKFDGEEHNYYELTYIDYGSMDTTINDCHYQLKAHDLILYGPKQFHTQEITESKSCSYLTVVFDMNIDDDSTLLNNVFHCTNDMHSILKKFINESSSQLPYSKTLMLCHLQEIIILLLQSSITIEKEKTPIKIGNNAIQHYQNELFNNIINYMNEKVYDPLTIEEICQKFSISRSSLQSLFKSHMNDSPKNHLITIKLQKSKELILENKYTISEIAFMLGFSSIHYFSRLFKQHFDIPPSEYAKQIYRK